MSAKAHDAPLTSQTALERMLLIRTVEERLLQLFSEGKLFGTTHTCIGQECCAVAVIAAVDRDKDILFSNHRCHGHFLAYTDDPLLLLAEIMGRTAGASGGRGGSQHLCARNFYSNGIQGGIAPVAAGMAFGEKLKASGAIAVCFIGDGTLGEGAVYETFNLASLWSLPILFVLEHNRYAQSTPTDRTIAGDVAARAAAFGIATDRRPADDPVALSKHMAEVIARVRAESRPFFQILDTYRLAAHSKGDDDRDSAEVAAARARDPLAQLLECSDTNVAAVAQATATQRVDTALQAAESTPYGAVEPEIEQAAFERRGHGLSGETAFAPACEGPAPLVVQNLNAALHHLFDEHPEVLLIGEDLVDPYGGAFKVSRGLSSRYPGRILSTPISESCIVGIGTGLSMRGLRPIVEIMFGDFLALTADQVINHVAKFRWMYNDQVETPLVIRTPVGGHRGYGPTHSQCLEKIFLGVPGLVVVAISNRHDPGELLRRAVVEDSRPVLFLEQKILYAKRLLHDAPAGMTRQIDDSEADAFYPTGVWRPSVAADVTLLTYGATTEMSEEAIAQVFDEDEIATEYIVPAQLAPLRIDAVLASTRRTGRLVIVEEGTTPWGFGAEVAATVASAQPGVRIKRVGAHHLPIPSARPAEQVVLPDRDRVVAALREVMR